MDERQIWVSATGALKMFQYFWDRLGGCPEPLGRRLIRMAANGKLTAICREYSETVRMSDAESKINDMMRESLTDDQYFDWLQFKKQEQDKLRPEFTVVPRGFWQALDDKGSGGKFLNMGEPSWDKGHFIVILGNEKWPRDADIMHALNDSGFQMWMARHVYFSEENLFDCWRDYDEISDVKDSNVIYSPNISEYFEKASIFRDDDDDISEGVEPDNPQRKGGRRGAQHGEAIAILTIQLLKLSAADLKRWTAESAAEELEQIYRNIGEVPPSLTNRIRYAQGILRTIRS